MVFKRYRKSVRRYKGKRTYKRKSKYMPKNSNLIMKGERLSRGILGFKNTFPERLMTKMMYNDRWLSPSVTAGSTTFAPEYRLNSVWDPEYQTATGQVSAAYYSVLSGIYRKYRVNGAKVTITVTESDSAPCSYTMVVWPYQNTQIVSFTSLSAERVAQYPNAISKSVNSAARQITISKYYNIANLFGKPKSALRLDDNFSSVISTNPSNQLLLAIGIQNQDSTNNRQFTINIKIKYYVEWYDRILSAGSFSSGPEVGQQTGPTGHTGGYA